MSVFGLGAVSVKNPLRVIAGQADTLKAGGKSAEKTCRIRAVITDLASDSAFRSDYSITGLTDIDVDNLA